MQCPICKKDLEIKEQKNRQKMKPVKQSTMNSQSAATVKSSGI